MPLKRSKKRGKYGAIKSVSPLVGRRFDSQLERRRGEELTMMERAGEISGLKFQPQIYLSAAKIGYKPDFYYVEDGIEFFEDTKGVETATFRLKARLWAAYGPAPLRVTVDNRKGGVTIKKTIHPPLQNPDA